MSALNCVESLKLVAALGTAAATGLMFSFSVITVPLLEAPEPGLNEFQRWRLWRKAFERGQATIPTTITPNVVMLAAAAYVSKTSQSRNLLLGAAASLLGVFVLTPTIMLGAGLRAELLDSVRNNKEDQEKAHKMVKRFQLFHTARIGLGILATGLAGYTLLL